MSQPVSAEEPFDIIEVLTAAVAEGASDVHLATGEPPVFRLDGLMSRRGARPLLPADIDAAVKRILPPDRLAEFAQHGEVDASFAIAEVARFRVNIFRQRGTSAAAIRPIPQRVLTLEELGMPGVLANLCQRAHGLVVITGPTGSGKSTTLAALIDLINRQSARHIITLEDPIEFHHDDHQSVINQREVGLDTTSFAKGLRAALRQDPDVILLGEMRDLETIEIALQAAETGHLVFATLHTNDASSTIDRIVDVFPPEQQQQVRTQLAGSLQAVVAQRLFPRRDGPGRVAALEILMVTPAVRNLIRDGKTHQIVSVIQTGGRLGMRTMEMSVRDLSERGVVTPDDLQTFLQETGADTAQTGAPLRPGLIGPARS